MGYTTQGDFDNPLDPEQEDRVQNELEPGEGVVWLGRPSVRRLALATTPILIFGIIWEGFSLFWVGSLLVMPDAPKLMALFGLPFIGLGLLMLASPVLAARVAGKTIYVVTDRRVLFLEATLTGALKTTSVAPGEIHSIVRLERADGSGNLSFSTAGRYFNESSNSTIAVTKSFVGVPRVRDVESALRKLKEDHVGA